MKHWRIAAIVIMLAAQVLAAPSLVQADSQPLPNQPNEPVGTEFTYQGYLTEGGAPAEGVFDFEISLYDAETGGNLADTLYFEDVPVTGGYFTVLLNFGAEMSLGEARWLEIGVRAGTDTGAYTTLDPRQALTAAPFAMSSPWTGLSGIPAGFADGVDDDTTYTAGTGLSLTDTAFSVNFAGTGTNITASRSDHTHTAYWGITGNIHTSSTINFIGTTDNVTLVFRVNNEPVLRLEPNATSPNIIGGYSGNSVTAGVYGATIGGGGAGGYPNLASDAYATVGGGAGNAASGFRSTVSGGTYNEASGTNATVGGGSDNQASGDYTTVGGGWANIASSMVTTVGGGYDNEASGGSATVGGGIANAASGYEATVGGGSGNEASGTRTTVGGGGSNTASGGLSTVGGGYNNEASGLYATVPGGSQANASHYGQMAYASGGFVNAGDAQASLYVMQNDSTGTAWISLYLDGSSERLTLASGQVMSFDILIVGGTDAGESAGYRIQGVIENIGGTTALIGTPTVTVLGEDDAAWNVQVLADNTNDALNIQVMGNGETIRWVASVQTVEVSWP